jgi:hypothetical protein
MDGTYNIVPPDFAQTQRNNYANLPLQTGSTQPSHGSKNEATIHKWNMLRFKPKIANLTNKKTATSIIQQETHLFSHNVSDFGCL